jgi:hypothetical protein
MRPASRLDQRCRQRLGRRGRAERASQGRARRGERRTRGRAAALARARSLATGNGVRYAYTDNARDPAGQSTHCHNAARW